MSAPQFKSRGEELRYVRDMMRGRQPRPSMPIPPEMIKAMASSETPRPLTRKLPSLFAKAREMWKTINGPKVTREVYEDRLAVCTGEGNGLTCPYLRAKKDKLWCGACGCGSNRFAELHAKLWYARLRCPRIPPLFEAVE